MTKTKKKNPWLVCLILFLMCLLIWPTGTQIAYAEETQTEETTYSNVLTDLKKDENFKQKDYPYVEDDYSLQVIQVAESEDNELFIYVYQPSGEKGNLVATSINMSPYSHQSENLMNYQLTLLNSSSVFYKYKIEDFQVRDDEVRYYEITSIFRPWIEGVDDKLENGNVVTEVAFPVSKLFMATEINGQTIYDCSNLKVVEITDSYVGFLRYPVDINIGVPNLTIDQLDNHFIAFSCDYDIDQLYEAKLSYTSQYVHFSKFAPTGSMENYDWQYDTPVPEVANVSSTGIVEIDSEFLWIKNHYEWEEIQSMSEFLASEDRESIHEGVILNTYSFSKITDEGLQDLQGLDWVLRFSNTQWYYHLNYGQLDTYFTQISEVTVLQLSFETEGVSYNLGVISNKQTGDGQPDNETNIFYELAEWVKWLLGIVGIILLVVLVIVLFPVIVTILKGLWWLIKKLGKIILYVISAPFKLFDKGEK